MDSVSGMLLNAGYSMIDAWIGVRVVGLNPFLSAVSLQKCLHPVHVAKSLASDRSPDSTKLVTLLGHDVQHLVAFALFVGPSSFPVFPFLFPCSRTVERPGCVRVTDAVWRVWAMLVWMDWEMLWVACKAFADVVIKVFAE